LTTPNDIIHLAGVRQSLNNLARMSIPEICHPIFAATRQDVVSWTKTAADKRHVCVFISFISADDIVCSKIPQSIGIVLACGEKLDTVTTNIHSCDFKDTRRPTAGYTHTTENIPASNDGVFSSADEEIAVKIELQTRHCSTMTTKRPQQRSRPHIIQFDGTV
jgi:hypothetical protein